jgi:hypothetical protein
MMAQLERTNAEWFTEAARYYLEGHQACVWCGGSHRVFKSERNNRQEYYCSRCDFYVCHDLVAETYFTMAGQEELAVA